MPHANDDSIPRHVLNASLAALRKWDEGREASPPSGLPESVRSIVHNLLLTLFRHRARIDWAIDSLTNKPVSPDALRNLLRVGMCQIFFMDGIAPATAVDECVELAGKRFGKKRGGFVNAVLRQAIRQFSPAFENEAGDMPPAARLELSEALCSQWSDLGEEALEDRARRLSGEAPLVVRLRPGAIRASHQRPVYLKALPAFEWAPSTAFFHCLEPQRLFSGEDLSPEHFYVQDPSTALAPSLLAPQANELVADLCAAPGGKTLLLSDLADGRIDVVAMDRNTRRIRRLLENAGIQPRIRILAGDAKTPPFPAASFDAVLLDVPCSNTGVIRRRPDVNWRFSQDTLNRLVELQTEILHAAAQIVRPGGRLVYSTCSLEDEENSRQIQGFIERHADFELAEQRQILPGEWHDGGFAARLNRK